ncbi:hypothetical protein ACLOJK_028536 [Asimina triloba]
MGDPKTDLLGSPPLNQWALLSRFLLPAALAPFSLTCASLLPLLSPPSTLQPLPFSLACAIRFPTLCPPLPYSGDRPSIFLAAARFLSTIVDSGRRTKSFKSSIFHYLASLPSAIIDSGRRTRSSIFQRQRRILYSVYSDLPFVGNNILSSLPCLLLDLFRLIAFLPSYFFPVQCYGIIPPLCSLNYFSLYPKIPDPLFSIFAFIGLSA